MLWLRKRQDDQLFFSDQDSKEYIKNEMISYSDYIKSIESIPLTDSLEKDIKWKAYQLVDIFFRCMIIYKWLCFPTEKEKFNFFKSFSNPQKLSKYISFSDLLPSEQINDLPTNIHDNLIYTFNEVLNDFAKEYIYVIKALNKKYFFHKDECYLCAYKNISYIFQTGLWHALQVHPKESIPLGILISDTKPIPILDFIKTPIWTLNESQDFEKELINKTEFFKKTVIQSIEYYTDIQKLYFAKLNTNEYLKQKCYFFEECESDVKVQFLSLLQDSNFVTIKNNCPEFQDYCFILLKARILKYENNILQAAEKDSWYSYYPGSFIHDKNLELQKHFNQINSYFMKLFDLKKNKDLNDKESYSTTYIGYSTLSKTTILPRLTELKISRKPTVI